MKFYLGHGLSDMKVDVEFLKTKRMLNSFFSFAGHLPVIAQPVFAKPASFSIQLEK